MKPTGPCLQKSVLKEERPNWKDGENLVITEWDFPNGLSREVKNPVKV